jgi:hypothetical protein
MEDRCTPATFLVNTELDDEIAGNGLYSLREAIKDSNATPGTDQNDINFAAGLSGKTILLNKSLDTITRSVNINGLGRDNLTVKRNSAGGDFRLLQISSLTTSTIYGLTLQDGKVPAGDAVGGGGAILSYGRLTVTACRLQFNSAPGAGGSGGAGGAILALNGTLDINSSDLNGNSAQQGGAVSTSAPLRITGGVISVNTSYANGGAIAVIDTTARLDGVEVAQNNGQTGGGGIYASGATTTLTLTGNTDIHNNTSGGRGGGVLSAPDGSSTPASASATTTPRRGTGWPGSTGPPGPAPTGRAGSSGTGRPSSTGNRSSEPRRVLARAGVTRPGPFARSRTTHRGVPCPAPYSGRVPRPRSSPPSP